MSSTILCGKVVLFSLQIYLIKKQFYNGAKKKKEKEKKKKDVFNSFGQNMSILIQTVVADTCMVL